ncbi:hypothetical protein NP493_154g02002 [Ridgeia piscesae]|uniref:Uncharacterized protein n=1 Tax=Ridgeia piscesae TaxID=27915 RepID=A0AAD9P435_RIDPI|nr:hypothetical protein NP493_154g02002 [Ridgeia piscesae]
MCLNHKQLETFKQLSYIFNMLLAKYFKESSYSKATAQMFDQLKMSRTTCDLAVVLWSLLWSLLWSGCGVAAYGGVGSTAWLSTFFVDKTSVLHDLLLSDKPPLVSCTLICLVHHLWACVKIVPFSTSGKSVM